MSENTCRECSYNARTSTAYLCPLHAASRNLLAAAELALARTEGNLKKVFDESSPNGDKWLADVLRAAIAKAKGES